MDTSLLRSSKSLGVVKESKRERLSRALKEQQAGIDVERNESILFEERRAEEFVSDDSSSGEDEKAGPVTVTSISKEPTKPPSIGSGLKRPLEVGDDGNPVIRKRRRGKKLLKTNAVQEPSWDGFTSTDSEGGFSDHGSDLSSSDVESLNSNQTESDTSRSASVDGPSSPSNHDVDANISTEESDVENDTDDNGEDTKARSSAFKAWATRQHNEVLGFTPSNNLQSNGVEGRSFTPRPPEKEPLPSELESNTATDATRTAFSVAVERTEEIQETRLGLPVVAEEQKIMEAIHNNPTVVIWGATGSGKTTQVPQFLYEAGYGNSEASTPGMIGITQPRRVAAVSMAKRVGQELGQAAEKVAYQVSGLPQTLSSLF